MKKNYDSIIPPDDQAPADRALAPSRGPTRSLLDEFIGSTKLPSRLRRQQKFLRFLKRAAKDDRFMESVQRLRDAVLRAIIKRDEDALEKDGTEADEQANGLIVALTGVRGGEGTSILSLMLALSLGGCVHRKIAHLDGHFSGERFDAVSRVFGLTRNEFSVFKGATEVWGCHSESQPNIYFLTSIGVDGSLDFFSDKQLRKFLAELRRKFDLTIIDMPPLLNNSSNVFLVPEVDHLYLTVTAGKTPLVDVNRCKELTEQQGKELSGVIVNQQTIPFVCRLFWRDYFF